VSPWTKEQRAIAAAHLCDFAAKLLRGSCPDIGVTLAVRAAQTATDGDMNDYRWSCGIAGLSPDDIDAAVAAIARGEHPPTSLPSMVAKYRDDAEAAVRGPSEYWMVSVGQNRAAVWLLALLGCEVPK